MSHTQREDPTIVERRHIASGGEQTSADAATSVPEPRAQASNLRLTEVIGRGGMGVVYRGEQVELGRQIAFKQLLDEYNDNHRERFLREARITAQLDHPSIVPVHLMELSRKGSPLGYAMKLVQGKTLRTLLSEAVEAYERNQPIDDEHALPTLLEHFLKVCDAMAFAHERSVLHRDLKPANIMIGKHGEVYVMDWGVARMIGADEAPESRREPLDHEKDPELTQAGEVVGSASYMSPEQAEGRNEELDARADQYALGLILFEILALTKAVAADSTVELFERAAKGQKLPLVARFKGQPIPRELAAIVEKATAFAPADRYASVTALAEDVRRHLRGDAVIALPDGPVAKLLRWASRHRRATLAAVLTSLALAATVTSFSLYRHARAELVQRARGERRTELFVEVAAQGHRLDAEFQHMEEALEGLSTAAEWALQGPEPTSQEDVIYLDTTFAVESRRPPDFTKDLKDTAYRWNVSVEFPVVGIAPGVDRTSVMPSLRKLAPLRHHFRDMFVGAAVDVGKAQPSPAEVREILLRRRGPIDYAYVDLPSGVHMVYPGMASLPPDYDVRTSGFYKMSEGKRGKRWGSPYIDSTTDEKGDDLVLPCTQGLWSLRGEFLGVAGVEITVTKLVETSMALPDRKIVRASLLTAEGKKVIDSGDAGRRFVSDGKDEGLALGDFELPEVVAAVRRGKDGLIELERDGRKLLVVFVRLDVLGWYYVVEVDAATVDNP